MGLWQVGADGINLNFGNAIWHQFRQTKINNQEVVGPRLKLD